MDRYTVCSNVIDAIQDRSDNPEFQEANERAHRLTQSQIRDVVLYLADLGILKEYQDASTTDDCAESVSG